MKAVIYDRYGHPEGLKLAEVDSPIPTADQILIKIQAVSINGSDREKLIGKPLYSRIDGLFKPRNKILGSDIAGRVEAVGPNITEFKAGEAVFGELPGYHGGLAEYVCTSGQTLLPKPPEMTFEEAAAIPQGGSIAYHAICRSGQVQSGHHVLINGAGGSAGVFAVQLAKLAGAEVTGVDNAGKLDFIRSLGADHALDYAREDYTKRGPQYDLILDLIAHRSVFAVQRALRPEGTYNLVGGAVSTMLQLLFLGPVFKRAAGKKMRLLAVPQNRQDLAAITDLCTSGQVTPVIDRLFSLNDAAEALRYVADGHARGKVVIVIGED